MGQWDRLYLYLTERREHLCEDNLLIPDWVVAVLLDRGLALQEARIRGLEGAKKGQNKGAGRGKGGAGGAARRRHRENRETNFRKR